MISRSKILTQEEEEKVSEFTLEAPTIIREARWRSCAALLGGGAKQASKQASEYVNKVSATRKCHSLKMEEKVCVRHPQTRIEQTECNVM